eukprot:TRINITY_DN1169_c1_g4_i1.p1 TRINITY_DN1169_c1_g4~~TRINITY_DN1169_c1_g4_i1.p1  ORF type:complete len:1388 (+),score=491.29 TRINITY_DN1169_c1_g4_i1:106-4269(+)
MGRVLTLRVSHFKSYRGDHEVGPFAQFSCIIGPNGAGKSNLLDALCFVFGSNARELRCSTIQDLIHRGEDRASVSVVMADDEGIETQFERRIPSAYLIDGKETSHKEYLAKLKAFHIESSKRNFLIAQHEASRLSEKSPKELSELFEKISGSIAFKEDYERAKKECAEARERYLSCYEKKRGALIEKHQFSLQLEEAKKFSEVSEELSTLKIQLMLFKLYVLERNIVQKKTELKEKKKILHKSVRKEERNARAIDKKKLERAAIHKEHLALEGSFRSMNKELSAIRPRAMKYGEELKRVKRSIAELQRKLEDKETERISVEEDLKKMKQDMSDVDRRLEMLSRDKDRETTRLASNHVDLSEEERHSFLEEMQQCREKTLTLRQEQERIQARLQTEQLAMDALKKRVEIMQEQKRTARTRREQAEAKMSVLEDKHAELIKTKGELKKSLENAEAKRSGLETSLGDTRKRQSEVESRLLDLKCDLRESERDQRIQEALEHFQRNYPQSGMQKKVYGRLIDLVGVVHDKYRIAVSTILAKHINSIVVSTTEVARECISYLRESRIGFLTFLPLDSLRPADGVEEYRSLAGASLCMDVLEYDPELETAVMYACGNSVICDSLESARRIAYGSIGDRKRAKVCTLDGIVIAKGGNITGGSKKFVAAQKQSKTFDAKESRKLKKERVDLRRQIDSILTQMPVIAKSIPMMRDKLAGVESELKEMRLEMTAMSRRVHELGKEEVDLENRLRPFIEEEKNLAHNIEIIKQEESELSRTLLAAERDALGNNPKFAQLLQVEREEVELQEKFGQQSAELRSLRSHFESAVEYTEKRKRDGLVQEVEKIRENIESFHDRVKYLERKEEKWKRKLESETSKFEKLKLDDEKLKRQVADKDIEIRELTAKHGERKAVERLKKEVDLIDADAERDRQSRFTLFEKCRLDGISLPLMDFVDVEDVSSDSDSENDEDEVDGNDMDGSGIHGEEEEEEDDDDDEHRVANRILRGRKRRHKMDPRAKRKSAARKDQDILSSEPFSPLPVVLSASSAHEDEENEENEGRNDMNVEVEGTAEIESESRRHTGGKRPRHSLPPEMIQLNFGILDPSLKKIRDPSEILRKQNSLDEQIRDAQLRRDKLNPNLKSDANFRLASERVVSSKNEIDQARREEREATGRFDDIREKRVQTYMECFDAVAQRIDAVYKRLTQEDVASMSRREDGESEQSSSPRNAHHDAPDGGSRVEEGEEDEDDRIISGGTAFLGLEMPDEPYLGGVKYNCTPPGKRADSHLSARSGGERTMSALALLFALHSIHPSPFFVFDEVDAALDKVNVQKVARYIETLSRKRKTQCIVISHKEGLFDHADVLFGVTRDAKTPSQSVVLSLDLRKYDARHHQQPHTRS